MTQQTEQGEEKKDWLGTVVAILAALAAVLGALVAWRASVVADASGDADFAGLKASLNAEETRALNYVNAYEHYGAFSVYSRYNELGNQISKDLESSDLSEEQTFSLQRQMAESYDLAKSNQSLFPNRFLKRDGTYSVQAEMGERWADAAKEKDLNPDPQFAEADALRQKSNRMLIALGVISISLVFYALFESVGDRLKYVMVGVGFLLMVGGTIAAFALELAK
jgi:hypothetical protein